MTIPQSDLHLWPDEAIATPVPQVPDGRGVSHLFPRAVMEEFVLQRGGTTESVPSVFCGQNWIVIVDQRIARKARSS